MHVVGSGIPWVIETLVFRLIHEYIGTLVLQSFEWEGKRRWVAKVSGAVKVGASASMAKALTLG